MLTTRETESEKNDYLINCVGGIVGHALNGIPSIIFEMSTDEKWQKHKMQRENATRLSFGLA